MGQPSPQAGKRASVNCWWPCVCQACSTNLLLWVSTNPYSPTLSVFEWQLSDCRRGLEGSFPYYKRSPLIINRCTSKQRNISVQNRFLCLRQPIKQKIQILTATCDSSSLKEQVNMCSSSPTETTFLTVRWRTCSEEHADYFMPQITAQWKCPWTEARRCFKDHAVCMSGTRLADLLIKPKYERDNCRFSETTPNMVGEKKKIWRKTPDMDWRRKTVSISPNVDVKM